MSGTALSALEGYSEFVPDHPIQIGWSEQEGNWSKDDYYSPRIGDQITSGAWSFDRPKTRLTSGFTATENTRLVAVMSKSSLSLGTVTTNIKEGGSIRGMIGYKEDEAVSAFVSKTDLKDFTWVEAGKGEEPKTDDTEGGKTEEDYASAMAFGGATILAAISALAF